MENILKETFSHLMQNRCFNLYFYNEYFMGRGRGKNYDIDHFLCGNYHRTAYGKTAKFRQAFQSLQLRIMRVHFRPQLWK